MKIRITGYIIYPPNYKPGDKYYKCRTAWKARNKARALGCGATIYRKREVIQKKNGVRFTERFMDGWLEIIRGSGDNTTLPQDEHPGNCGCSECQYTGKTHVVTQKGALP